MDRQKTKYLISVIGTISLSILGVQAWSGLTASPGDKLDYQKWNELVASVQSNRIPGEVAAFNLATCPTGWSEYTQAVGRTIIGVGSGAGSNTTLGNVGGEKSAPAISATHNLTVNVTGDLKIGSSTPTAGAISISNGTVLVTSPAGPPSAGIYAPAGTTADLTVGPTQNFTSTVSGGISLSGVGTAPDNMQPYVALLYCVKN